MLHIQYNLPVYNLDRHLGDTPRARLPHTRLALLSSNEKEAGGTSSDSNHTGHSEELRLATLRVLDFVRFEYSKSGYV